VSSKFYIYWAFVAPVTITSVLLWYLYIFKNSFFERKSAVDSVDVEKVV
jgi:hypothetical protein